MTNLSGQVAVVTGGASGIGEGCARMMADRGATVVVADINTDAADKVASAIGGHAIELDVVSEEATARAVEHTESAVGPADILVTSAGVAQKPTAPEQYSMADWDRVVDIDLRGTYLSAAAYGGRMAARGSGSIITIASITGLRSVPVHAYGPAKAAVIAMTSNLAAEWGRSGVRVNGIAPGYTRTPLLQGLIDIGERDETLLAENSTLGRMVETDEIAKVACFLASDQSSGVTGVTIPVDAGWLATASWHTYGGLPQKR